MHKIILLIALHFAVPHVAAQDTFSIVAVDSITGEVGSAGASCISRNDLMAALPGKDPD